MKHARNIICILAAIFFIAYLLGSFFATSFNISEWEEGVRGSVIAGFCIASFAATMGYGMSQPI